MVSIITSTLTTQAKQQEKLRMENEKEKMRANLLRSVSHDTAHRSRPSWAAHLHHSG